MDHRITQCPRCGTSFRVTEAHLAVAAGAVRCGSCLHIFNAREHWAEEKPEPEPEPATTVDEQQALDDLVIDDDALFDDNTPLFPEDRLAATEQRPARDERPARASDTIFNPVDDDFALIDDDEPEELATSFTDLNSWEEDVGTSFGRVQDLDEELSASDEEWTQNLLRDDEPFFADAPPPASEQPSSTPLGTDSGAQLADYGFAAEEPTPGRLEPTFDSSEPNADSGLFGYHADSFDDLELQLDPPATQFDSSTQHPDAIAQTLAEDSPQPLASVASADAGELDLNAEFLNIPAAHSVTSPGPDAAANQRIDPQEDSAPASETIVTDESYSTELYTGDRYASDLHDRDPLASLNRLGAEPLQIHQFKHEPRWPKVLRGLGLVALLALLAGQYIHANFDTLARGPARPWLAQACQWADCALPPQSDVTQIRSGNLIVRSHPSQQGALAVDAIITNLAPFPQPYPQLQLQFSDLNGTPVAGRRFLPAEYLAGELSGAALMPTQQPVHIALELVDPGPQAVNYSLTVVQPTAAP